MGQFRKVDSLLPEAASDDIFGQHAVKLISRALKIGYQAAIDEELASPTWDDPDWCRMIVARSQGQTPKFPDDERITFRCPQCRDTGFIEQPDSHRYGPACRVHSRCDPCAYRLWAKAQWLRKQEVEGVRRVGRFKSRDSEE